MKTDDIFEALTDIDDKFIAAARPTELGDEPPAVFRPAPRKPIWKTLVPVAACAAVISVAGVFGARFVKDRLYPQGTTSTDSEASYDQTVDHNVSRISLPDDGSDAVFTMEEFPGFEFRASYEGVVSYLITSAETDAVISEDLFDEGISIYDLYLADLNGDGKREICAAVHDAGNGDGIVVNEYSGRYRDKDTVTYTADKANTVVIDGDLFYMDGTVYSLFAYGDNVHYTLKEENGVLNAVKYKISSPFGYYKEEELLHRPLTLSMMTRVIDHRSFEEIKIPPMGTKNEFTMEEFPDNVFAVTTESVIMNGFTMNAVDVLLIHANHIDNLFLCDLNGDGMREICVTVQNNNGKKSIEVVDLANGDNYVSIADLPAEIHAEHREDAEDLMMYRRSNSGDYALEEDGPLSLDRLIHIYSNTSAPIRIGEEKYFKLTEYPNRYFINQDGHIIMSHLKEDAVKREVISGDAFYLADINGDGNREICSYSNNFVYHSYIRVYDVLNNETYVMANDPLENGTEWLELKDSELYAVRSAYVNDVHVTATSRVPLTMSVLQKTEKPDHISIPLLMDHSFRLSEYDRFTFDVSYATDRGRPSLKFSSWACDSVINYVDKALLCDLDGDGAREIILNCPLDEGGCIKIYGFMDNGEIGEAVYRADGGCVLKEDGVKLCYVTQGEDPKPLEFSKSDLRPIFANSFVLQSLGWNHSIKFTDTFPWSSAYDISIKGNKPVIKHGTDTIVDYEYLYYLFSIPDEDNDCLIFFMGGALSDWNYQDCAIKLTANSAEQYYFDEITAVKINDGKLILVDSNGERPFALPEQYDVLF